MGVFATEIIQTSVLGHVTRHPENEKVSIQSPTKRQKEPRNQNAVGCRAERKILQRIDNSLRSGIEINGEAVSTLTPSKPTH